MKINKYRLGSKVEYNPAKYVAPGAIQGLFNAAHMQSESDLFDVDSGLDFEYSLVDEPYAAPVVKKLRGQIDDISSKLATEGYNPRLASQLVNLKKQYQREMSPQGTLGRIQGNYRDMSEQWAELEKNYRKQNAPDFFIQDAKSRFMSNYTGAFDGSGNFQKFTPGRVSGYYNVHDDIQEALANVKGKLGQIVGGDNAAITIDTSTGFPMFKVVNTRTGQVLDNSKNLTAGVNALMRDYLDPNQRTDRSLFASNSGLDANYLYNMASDISNSMQQTYYNQLPGQSTSFMNTPKPEKGGPVKPPTDFNVGVYETGVEENKSRQRNIDNKYSKIRNYLDDSGNIDKNKIDAAYRQTFKVSSGMYPADDYQMFLEHPEGIDVANWRETKQKYSKLYDNVKNGGITIGDKTYSTDADFLELAEAQERAEQARFVPSYNLHTDKAFDTIMGLIQEVPGGKGNKKSATFIEYDSKGDPIGEVSREGIAQLVRDSPLDKNQIPFIVDDEGNFTIQLTTKVGKRREYKLNPEALPSGIPKIMERAKEIESYMTDMSITADEVEAINDKGFNLDPYMDSEGNLIETQIQIYINPSNIFDDREMKAVTKVTSPDGNVGYFENGMHQNIVTKMALESFLNSVSVKNKPGK